MKPDFKNINFKTPQSSSKPEAGTCDERSRSAPSESVYAHHR